MEWILHLLLTNGGMCGILVVDDGDDGVADKLKGEDDV